MQTRGAASTLGAASAHASMTTSARIAQTFDIERRILCGALQIALDLAEHRVDFADRPFEIVARNVERRRDAHDRAVRVLRQNATREQPVDDRSRRDVPRIDFDADEKTPA